MSRLRGRMSGYDVFEILSNGDVLWHHAAQNFAEAKEIAERKAARAKRPFLILDQETQTKVVVGDSEIPKFHSPIT